MGDFQDLDHLDGVEQRGAKLAHGRGSALVQRLDEALEREEVLDVVLRLDVHFLQYAELVAEVGQQLRPRSSAGSSPRTAPAPLGSSR